ncbi:MAG: iron complex outermembrane receptor protein [Litorivivens sp.]|jgi:iron complex outermembrane receptor protein
MKFRIWLSALLVCIGGMNAFAQKGNLIGVVSDDISKGTLINAYVRVDANNGTATDFEGRYSLELDYGTYEVDFSYVGYKSTTRTVTISKKEILLNVSLDTEMLNAAQIVADVARERETPVAFTNILPAKLDQELASQELPMILNSTPGVYATQQGGGDGDARVTIRGFDQNNIAVMLDGVPVNDMENGWVYWSNWFGLDAVTQSMQVQRGLGASKIAIPSVGGTINIITKGIDAKKGVKLKQEVGSFGFTRTTLGLTSGRMKNGWGVTAAGSFKRGDGWFDQGYTKGWFYYLKIEKQLGDHVISLSGMGAPQSHAQRSFKSRIGTFDADYAVSLGVDSDEAIAEGDYGTDYNEHWGIYNENAFITDENGAVTGFVKGQSKTLNSKVNYYHKPQFSLRDFWSVNDKLYVSNIAYLSVGSGGGTGLNSSSSIGFQNDGSINFQEIYDNNLVRGFDNNLNMDENGEIESNKWIRSAINNHFWYGYIGSLTWKPTDIVTIAGGLDFRRYKGEHYQTPYNLIGGDYILDSNNLNAKPNTKVYAGDKYRYWDEGHVAWGGGFVQAEAKTELWSAFVNFSVAQSGYKAIDHFLEKTIEIDGQTYAIGYGDEIEVDGKTYNENSAGVETFETDWVKQNGFTLKGGANLNVNEFFNVFANVGYLSKAAVFNNVIDRNNNISTDYSNEVINGYEIGLSWRKKSFASNVNGYYTEWNNRPVNAQTPIAHPQPPADLDQDARFTAFIKSMDALHYGVEWDFAWNVTSKLTVEGILSVGDWTWTSQEEASILDEDGQLVLDTLDNTPLTILADPRGVHVGNAAQFQTGGSIQYNFLKSGYIQARGTYFGRHFADFNPESTTGDNAGRESWRVPNYFLLDLNLGYTIKGDKLNWNIRTSINNVLNQTYISDATNNATFQSANLEDFDARSSAVFFGPPRRINISLTVSF